MYQVYADDHLVYSTGEDAPEYLIVDPVIRYEMNKPAQFSFCLPPGHPEYETVRKQKTEIRVMEGGEEIFRGRVTNDETDFFRQKQVDCESELAFLRDTLQRPYEYDGTPLGLFLKLLENHNQDAAPAQRFTPGNITAVTGEGRAQADLDEYSDTLTELTRRMIGAYGGQLRIRHKEGVRYLDYLSDGEESGQPIAFGVNLLDLKESVSAEDVFNVLIPQGTMLKAKNGKYEQSLKIGSVNGGLDYLEDEASIERYGKRIWRTKQWSYITDPAELMKKGREYLAVGLPEETSLHIRAVDMHFAGEKAERISVGDRVRIVSQPHGISRTEVCAKIVLWLNEPDKNEYTFGSPRTSLTDNVALIANQHSGGGRGGKTLEEEISDIRRWAKIRISEAEGRIELSAGEINDLIQRMKTAEVLIDGVNADIRLTAADLDTLTRRMTQAEIDIDGIAGEISLRATKSELDAMGKRITTAEASITLNTEAITLKVSKDGIISAINQTAESVTISASRINLSGYVTASQLQATNANISNITSGITTATVLKAMLFTGDTVDATSIVGDVFNFGGKPLSRRSMTVSTPEGEKTIYYVGYMP